MQLPTVNPKQFLNDKIASYQYFDFPEDGEKINGMILGVPRKDIPETKSYDDFDDPMKMLSPFNDLVKGYSPLIPEPLREKYKKEDEVNKYLKNIERLKKRGIV
tara:strand:- start:253 stop:564 length:312 start_codon:yes stop_codon:yes gene_type:complete